MESIIMYKDYGDIIFDIKTVMDKKTGLHHKVVRRYYDGTVIRYDKDVLSKLCFVLGCDLKDIMYYQYNIKNN